MVSGVAPNEASDRLIIFQVCFPSKLHASLVKDFLWHKMNFLLYFIFSESFRCVMAKVHYIFRRRRAVWLGGHRVSGTNEN